MLCWLDGTQVWSALFCLRGISSTKNKKTMNKKERIDKSWKKKKRWTRRQTLLWWRWSSSRSSSSSSSPSSFSSSLRSCSHRCACSCFSSR